MENVSLKGRCGPDFNDQVCTADAKYCNRRNGWCGNSDAHKGICPGGAASCWASRNHSRRVS